MTAKSGLSSRVRAKAPHKSGANNKPFKANKSAPVLTSPVSAHSPPRENSPPHASRSGLVHIGIKEGHSESPSAGDKEDFMAGYRLAVEMLREGAALGSSTAPTGTAINARDRDGNPRNNFTRKYIEQVASTPLADGFCAVLSERFGMEDAVMSNDDLCSLTYEEMQGGVTVAAAPKIQEPATRRIMQEEASNKLYMLNAALLSINGEGLEHFRAMNEKRQDGFMMLCVTLCEDAARLLDQSLEGGGA